MCGITGIVNLNGEPVSPVLLRKMTDAIAHRGPDGEGFYTDSSVGLGHRRLSIIDLSSAGNQPMLTKDGRYALIYNGEIYNFQELRVELESCGHTFHSATDSEVLLNAYVEWGTDCLEKFNGMFAFVIWDKLRRELFIARDRYGIKPLYYCFCGNTFLFGSEQKAIITHPSFKKVLDKEALVEYFTFQNIFTDKTLLKGVKLFPAGSFAKLSAEENKTDLTIQCYWDYHFEEPSQPLKEEEYLEELDRLFKQAVSRQLVSDVEVGTYLSGGMDSGSITAVAASQLPYIKTFTCGFDLNSASGLELAFDEREKAEYMSYLFKTEHYEMVLKAGDMERVLPRLTWHLEEPRVGQSYPNFYVAQLASKFVKVVHAGTGGDELFAGYPWRYYRTVNSANFGDYVNNYYEFWQRLIPGKQVYDVFAPIWNEIKHVNTRDIFRGVFHEHAEKLTTPEDYVNHSLYFEAKTFLHGLLVVEDKLSMAHGLENRVPFLDNDLVDFAMKVPVNMKLGHLQKIIRQNENEPGLKTERYYEHTHDGKLLLRKAMKKYIPDEVTQRKKQGFSSPDASWFKGDSIEYVRKKLLSGKSPVYEFMNTKTIHALIDDHLEGTDNRRLLIWSLLNFDECCKQYNF